MPRASATTWRHQHLPRSSASCFGLLLVAGVLSHKVFGHLLISGTWITEDTIQLHVGSGQAIFLSVSRSSGERLGAEGRP
mmetsp:Transcript_106695/g.340548  ORF Transcript_106695/g.340548 Transcript_106695/m.340548 type:complete len:80 (+) Transcript_106695:146-385(+)